MINGVLHDNERLILNDSIFKINNESAFVKYMRNEKRSKNIGIVSYVHAKYTSKALRVMHIHRNRDVSLIFRSVRKQ